MNGYGLVFLLSLSFLFITCTEPSSKTTKEPLATKHSYGEKEKEDKKEEELKPRNASTHQSRTASEVQNDDLLEKYRHVWQKPFEVIQQIGDLKGKTVADIGAGPLGYFSILIAAQNEAEKVLAIDIDQKALDYIEDAKKKWTDHLEKIETRLAEPNNPRLKEGEADIVLIVNTAVYFNNRVDYLRNLRQGLKPEGKLVIIDFKKRNSPVGPPTESRISLFEMERELAEAGYSQIKSDDRTLEYQYIIMAGI